MRNTHLGLRRAGFAGVASALALGGALVAAAPASAESTFTAEGQTGLAAGAISAPVANLNYTFTNDFGNNASVTFKIGDNDCSTPAGLAKAVGLKGGDTVTANITTPAGAGARTANVTYTADSECALNGFFDEFTVALDPVSLPTGAADLVFGLKISGIKYTVGANADLGVVPVTATGSGGLGDGTASNAAVVGTGVSLAPFKAAQPNSDATLGDIVITESGSGSTFDPVIATDDVVTIDVADGADPDPAAGTFFNTSVKPTVTATGGNTVAPADITFPDADTVQIVVKNAAATTAPASVTVKGLSVATGSADQVFVKTQVDGTVIGAAAGLKALNVIDSDERIGGADRYATAVEAYESEFAFSSNAVLASGESFPDALAANYLAEARDTGLLLTKAGSLPKVTRDAIIANGVERVYILGGNTAVSAAVEAEIESLNVSGSALNPKIQTVRLGGANRYATNKAINAEAAEGNEGTVLMASGADFPDALALGPVSYSQNLPLILSNGTSLTADDIAQLDEFNATKVIIAGGDTAVSPAVVTALTSRGIAVTRLEGATRHGTATAIAAYAKANFGFGSTTGLATGLGFADALAAGPALGNQNATLLLTQSASDLSVPTSTYLGSQKVGTTGIDEIIAIGGTTVVSGSVVGQAALAVEK